MDIPSAPYYLSRIVKNVAQETCVEMLKVLADPTRLAVVAALMDGPKHVGEINSALHLDQSLLSHHLKVLRQSKLVSATRHGKAVLYSLVSKVGSKKARAIDLGCCRLSFD